MIKPDWVSAAFHSLFLMCLIYRWLSFTILCPVSMRILGSATGNLLRLCSVGVWIVGAWSYLSGMHHVDFTIILWAAVGKWFLIIFYFNNLTTISNDNGLACNISPLNIKFIEPKRLCSIVKHWCMHDTIHIQCLCPLL